MISNHVLFSFSDKFEILSEGQQFIPSLWSGEDAIIYLEQMEGNRDIRDFQGNTLLHTFAMRAMMDCNFDVVERLLELGVDPAAKNNESLTVLEYVTKNSQLPSQIAKIREIIHRSNFKNAISCGADKDVLREFIKKHKDALNDTFEGTFTTPLDLAFEKYNPTAVELLLEMGASESKTTICCKNRQNLLEIALNIDLSKLDKRSKQNLYLIKELLILKRKQEARPKIYLRPYPILLDAVIKFNRQDLERYLEDGADVLLDSQQTLDQLLFSAIVEGNIDAIHVLVARGANMNALAMSGQPYLQQAIILALKNEDESKNRLGVIEALLLLGADPYYSLRFDGETALALGRSGHSQADVLRKKRILDLIDKAQAHGKDASLCVRLRMFINPESKV